MSKVTRIKSPFTRDERISPEDIITFFTNLRATHKSAMWKFSRPTLKKYIQFGLLPYANMQGEPGNHRGSFGTWPGYVVDRIITIKELIHGSGVRLEDLLLTDTGKKWTGYDAYYAVWLWSVALEPDLDVCFPPWFREMHKRLNKL